MVSNDSTDIREPSLVFLNAFLTPDEIENFPKEFPFIKHYQWIEGFFYAIYLKPKKQNSLSFNKKISSLIALFQNEPTKQEILPETSVAQQENHFCDHPIFIRPFSIADYYNLNHFEDKKSYEVEEVMLSLYINFSMVWNFSLCFNTETKQKVMDSVDKCLRNIYEQINFKSFQKNLFDIFIEQALTSNRDDICELTNKGLITGHIRCYKRNYKFHFSFNQEAMYN